MKYAIAFNQSKKRRMPLQATLFLLLASIIFTDSLIAQSRELLSGEVPTQLEEESVDTYQITKDSILQKLSTLERVMEDPFNPLEAPPRFSSEELLMLASLHLYCTLKEGVCTLIPFTIFESDLIASAREEKATCPNLLFFWKQWLSADMEKRVDMDLGVVHYDKRSEYKRTKRSQLLRCSKTIASMLETQKDVKGYLSERYGKKKELPTNLKLYITELHKKISDIYQETGVRK